MGKGGDGKVTEDAIKLDIDAAKEMAEAAQRAADGANTILNGTSNNGLVAKVTTIDAIVNGTDTLGDDGETTHTDGLVDTVGAHTEAIAGLAQAQADCVTSDGTSLLYKGKTIIFDCGNSGVE